MANPDFVEIVLTCASWQEAQKITDVLLEQHLVACVELVEVKSKNWWQGELENSNEIKLIMQSRVNYFDRIEEVVKKLHSYETPNLHAMPIVHVTDDVKAWLEAELYG